MIDLTRLTELIHKVPGGCTVTLTSIHAPEHNRGSIYGIVTLGHTGFQRTFKSEEELLEIMGRYTA